MGTFFYSFAPLSVMASRCFMPDTPSLSLSIIALYLFLRWIEKSEPGFHTGSTYFFASALCLSMSILIKAPSALIGVPLAYLVLHRFGLSAFRRVELWIFAVIALVPSVIWYWHAHDIAQRFYPHHFFGAGGIRLMDAGWYWKIARETTTSSLTPFLCILASGGVFVTRSTNCARLFQWWLAAMILFIIVVGYGNRHPWYQLPLVPIAAAFAGAACAFLAPQIPAQKAKITFAVLLVAIFGAFVLNYTPKFYRPSAIQLYSAGLELKRIIPRGSLIVAADYGDPTLFYYAERKGWHFLEKDGIYNGHPATSQDAINDLEQLKKRGASYVVFYSATFWWLDYYKDFAQHLVDSATLMEATPEFRIYKLNRAIK
jgi:4-amino-4-deoxy-L-arabinose transferase-like glycosyltransferase